MYLFLGGDTNSPIENVPPPIPVPYPNIYPIVVPRLIRYVNTSHFIIVCDLVQPKMSHFSTRALISVNCKFVHRFSQLIFILSSHLNSALQNLVIELCRALKIFFFNGYLVNWRTLL